MNLINRPLYIERLKKLRERDEIKILVGARGVGKTSILDLFAQNLLMTGIKRENIIRIDLDTLEFHNLKREEEFYDLLITQISKKEKNFLLIDEISRVNNWQLVIDKIKKEFETDIYITSSIKISDLKFSSILLNILPLSFREFQTFYKTSEILTLQDQFELYLKIGGMPATIQMSSNASALASTLTNNFSSSLLQDVFIGSKITDFTLMTNLTKKLSEQAGIVHSFNSISKLFNDKPAVRTIENYTANLLRSHLFYSIPVKDFNSSHVLSRYTKYYPVDFGYRNLILGDQFYTQEILETVVYFELLRLGVDVSGCRIGKSIVLQADRKELDDKIYINVVKNTNIKDKGAPYSPLRSIKNLFAKWVITAEENISNSADGIKVTNILDFLMSE